MTAQNKNERMQKLKQRLRKGIGSRKFWIRNLAAVSAAAAVLAGALWARNAMAEQRQIQEEVASQVIRFHVLAESDRHNDQQIKLAVRDHLLETMGSLLEGKETLEETRECLNENLDLLSQEAESVVRKAGSSAAVTVQLTRADFPVKTYGAYRFPAGEYETLQVKIGEGRGHNWWCLIFPSLCFQNSLKPVISEDGERKLKYVLSDEAYDSILQKDRVSIGFLWF